MQYRFQYLTGIQDGIGPSALARWRACVGKADPQAAPAYDPAASRGRASGSVLALAGFSFRQALTLSGKLGGELQSCAEAVSCRSWAGLDGRKGLCQILIGPPHNSTFGALGTALSGPLLAGYYSRATLECPDASSRNAIPSPGEMVSRDVPGRAPFLCLAEWLSNMVHPLRRAAVDSVDLGLLFLHRSGGIRITTGLTRLLRQRYQPKTRFRSAIPTRDLRRLRVLSLMIGILR
jgi:hypothetical protein